VVAKSSARRFGYSRGDKRKFARIQFIKILREWERAAKSEPRSAGNPDIASLRSVKEFADEIWKNHEER